MNKEIDSILGQLMGAPSICNEFDYSKYFLKDN